MNVKQTRNMEPNGSRRSFDEAFKRRAVALIESGRSVAQISRELEVSPFSLYEWKREFGQTAKPAVPAPSALIRLAVSFTAAFLGWCATLASYCIWMVFFTYSGRVTDWNFFSFWSAVFVFVAWVLIAAALTQVPALQRFELSPLTVCGLGTAVAALSYVLLVLTWAPLLGYIVFAMIVGAIAGLAYPLLLRLRVRPGIVHLLCLVSLCIWLFVACRR